MPSIRSSPPRATHPGRLILCATGPLTNIALARDARAGTAAPRQAVRHHGRRLFRPGNVTPSAEFNIWHDPEAARIVFRAFGGVGAAPVIAIGLDVTRKTIIDESDIAAVASRIAGKPHGAKLTRFLEDASRFYFERMEKMLGKRIFTMHDPLAVAVALDPTLVETRRAAVDVETTGRLTTGATIVDWRGQWGRLANTEVAVAVDAERFRRLFFDAMARLADGSGRTGRRPSRRGDGRPRALQVTVSGSLGLVFLPQLFYLCSRP